MLSRLGNHGRKAAWLSFAVLALAPLLATPSHAFDQDDLDTLNNTGSCTGAAAANGTYCDLSNADLTGADLSYAGLEDADLSNSNLTGADLTGVIYCNTTWTDGTIKNDGCPGTITIIKNTVGGNGEFDFTGGLGDFTIITDNATGTETFPSLTPARAAAAG